MKRWLPAHAARPDQELRPFQGATRRRHRNISTQASSSFSQAFEKICSRALHSEHTRLRWHGATECKFITCPWTRGVADGAGAPRGLEGRNQLFCMRAALVDKSR